MNTLFPENFSVSMFADIGNCELAFFRKHCQRLVTKEAKSPDLIAGSHFASGCEIARKSYYNEKKSEEESIELGKEYILLAEDTRDYIKSNEKVAFALEKYFKKFPLEGLIRPVALVDGTFAIEYVFIFDTGIKHPDIPDRNIKIKGKLDMIGERFINGVKKIVLIDEKSTKSISRVQGTGCVDLALEEKKYYAEGQLMCYAWAAKQLGIKLDEALIRKVPVLKEHEDAFELHIPVKDFLITHWSFAKFDLIAELVEKYKFYKSNIDKENVFIQTAFRPEYNKACFDWNRPCSYISGCLSKEGEELLEMEFQQQIWDSEKKESVSLIEYKQKLNIIGDKL